MTGRELMIDLAVRRVIKRGFIHQGFSGFVPTNLSAVRDWLEAGCPLSSWWFAFTAHVQAEYRLIVASSSPSLLDERCWGGGA